MMEEGAQEQIESGIEIKDVIIGIVISIFIAFFIRIMIGEILHVPSNSMEPSLLIGDNVLVSKIAYSIGPAGDFMGMKLPDQARIWFSKPKKQDIVVFRPPASALPPGSQFVLFVKRVIGGPRDEHPVTGDVIPAKGMVIASNSILASMLKMIKDPGTISGNTYIVGEDYYYVLGDNRNQSFDSQDWGLIPASSIIGKAVMVLWSSQIDEQQTSSLRTDRFFQLCR
jgi:signal peptidase I